MHMREENTSMREDWSQFWKESMDHFEDGKDKKKMVIVLGKVAASDQFEEDDGAD